MNSEAFHIKESTGVSTDEPIDVVIAWVDGSDPKLAEKRSR